MTIGYPQNRTMSSPVFPRTMGMPFANPHPMPYRSFGAHSFNSNENGQSSDNPFSQPASKPYSMQGVWASPHRPEMREPLGQQAPSIDGLYMANPQNHPWISAFNQGIAHGLRYLKPDIGDSIAREGPNFSPNKHDVSTARDFMGRQMGEWKRTEVQEFTPEVDIRETKEASIVSVSLPGGKKENCKVAWDPETSQLIVTGTIERESCEGVDTMLRFRKQERKSGAFRRNVSLGAVGRRGVTEVDAISAKMEAGVLEIIVTRPQPLDDSHWTIDIE